MEKNSPKNMSPNKAWFLRSGGNGGRIPLDSHDVST